MECKQAFTVFQPKARRRKGRENKKNPHEVTANNKEKIEKKKRRNNKQGTDLKWFQVAETTKRRPK